MKKFFIILSSIIGLFLVAIITIPLFVNVDKFRPEVVQAVNEKINGKFELGKMSLSLWGQVRIEVDGVKLTDARGNEIISVKDAYFHLPFSSLLSGSPALTFRMNKPQVSVLKLKNGKMNVLSLMKETPVNAATTAAGTAGPATPATSEKSTSMALPAIAMNARLGIELLNAKVNYADETNGLKSTIDDLNFRVKDISLTKTTQFEVTADLATKMVGTFDVKGPLKIVGTFAPKFKADGNFESGKLSVNGNFDELDIQATDKFHKKSGIPANFQLEASASQENMNVEKFDLKFHNMEIISKVEMKNTGAPQPTTELKMNSNEFALAPWAELVPMLSSYDLGGTMKITAEAAGVSNKLTYKLDMHGKELSAKAPNLKTKPLFDFVLKVSTDRVEELLFSMTAPGNDITFKTQVESFSKPQINLSITSQKGLDLDQLLVLPPLEKKADAATANAAAEKGDSKSAGGKSGTSKEPAADYDAMVEPVRKNEMLVFLGFQGKVAIPVVKVYDVKMTDIAMHATFKNLVASIESASMNVFDGKMSYAQKIDLKPKHPTYSLSAEVAHLDLKKAVSSQFELFKNTLFGNASFKMVGTGESFNTDLLLPKLDMKGNFKVVQAKFATLDVGKMTSEALNKSIDKVGEKVPQAKGKSIKKLPGRESVYDFVGSDFTIVKGIFSMPNFQAKAAKGQGVDFEGATTANLINDDLSAKWKVIDTQNLTGARDIAVDIGGTRVEHVLSENNQPVTFPISAGCKMTSPCFQYTDVPAYFAQVAFNNVRAATEGKAKAEATKKVQEAAKKALQNAPAPVQDAVKKFGGGLFGN